MLGAGATIRVEAADAAQAVLGQAVAAAQGVLVTAPSPGACAQAFHLSRRKGFVGSPPGDVPASICDCGLTWFTVRCANVGTRAHLIEAIACAPEGRARARARAASLDDSTACCSSSKPEGSRAASMGHRCAPRQA